jgi:O-antigen/teichoic acid export membrane protein
MTQQQSFTKAITWAYTLNWGERIFSALFVLFLASLLGPKDFGIVSIAIIYVTFLQMFLDQGFATAIIQRQNLEQEHLDSVFVVNLVLSLGLVIISLLFSRAWAAIYGAPEIAIISSALSLSIVIHAMTLVPIALLTRQMNFRSLSIRTNFSTIISGIVGILMAWEGFGVWSLVCQRLLADLISLVLVWRMSSWRPSFKFSWQHVRELMGFSVGNFLTQLALFFDLQAGSVVLGILFGPAVVGLYRAADRIMFTVVGMAVSSIQHVSLPQFSRFQDQPHELRKSVRICVQMSAWVSLPALAGLAAVSRPLMDTIGPNWAPATDALKALCVYGIAIVLTCFTVPLMQARGKTRQVAILEWARTLIGLILVAVTGLLLRDDSIQVQVMSIAVARLLVMAALVMPIFLYLLMKLATLSIRDFVVLIGPSVLASIGVVASIVLFRHLGPAVSKPLIQLIGEVFIGGIAGLTILLSADAQLRMSIRRLRRAVAES